MKSRKNEKAKHTVPHKQKDHLEYPSLTMYEMIERVAKQYPNEPAYEFYGRRVRYKDFISRIDRAARAFLAAGVKPGDAVTLCLPNIPQALDCFYALDRIGAIANMTHPLSAKSELQFYLTLSQSKVIVTADLFYETVYRAVCAVDFPVKIIVARMQEELPPALAALYIAKKGKDYLRYPGKNGELYKSFLRRGKKEIPLPETHFNPKRTSVILYSGGTTGTPKGVCLSDLNFNACAMQAREAIGFEFRKGLKMLSCMPLFHGFGLGINIHTVLAHGAMCILMPTFNTKSYARMLLKKKPSFIAGVPTIFEALLHIPQLENADLSCLLGMFCGGDSLSVELKKKIDHFLTQHGAHIQVREGYGLTECVTASCLTPRDTSREGSIGIPFPDTEYRVVQPDTQIDVPDGEEGEIILRGPSVMLGYLNNIEETEKALRVLSDGNTWLYTGDLGVKDADGYIYFRQRIKRMIVSNGYNIYPGQLENVIDSCPEVAYSCVIGVPDSRRMSRVRAYIVLKENVSESHQVRDRILERLRMHVAKYALPREFIFRRELPLTLVGKVAYRKLEEEALRELGHPVAEGEA